MNGLGALKHFIANKNFKAGLNKWRRWARRVLQRRGLTIDLSICAYGKTHLVDKVQPFGGGFVFWSRACDGCQLGQVLIKLKGRKPSYTHCVLLESGLLTRDPVKPGDIYALPDIKV